MTYRELFEENLRRDGVPEMFIGANEEELDEPIAFTLTVPIDEERKGSGEALRERCYTLILTAEGEDAEAILRAFGRK